MVLLAKEQVEVKLTPQEIVEKTTIAEISPYPDFMKIAVEYNLPIITSSDAHKPEHCGNHIDDAISYAKSFGYNQSIRFTKRQREFVELG